MFKKGVHRHHCNTGMLVGFFFQLNFFLFPICGFATNLNKM